jgi:hypothetical protein
MHIAPFLRDFFCGHPEAALPVISVEPAGLVWSGLAKCLLCGHQWVAVVEIELHQTEPEVPLECGWCHNMTGAPK